MEFEWDEAKRLSNLDKHGIDFLDVEEVFDGDIVTVEDDFPTGTLRERSGYGERRFVTFGLLQGRVVAVVYTDRGDAMRLISVRKATQYEQRTYYAQISN
ncbi:MAG: hypothetical protein RLZZ511_2177 [Cyanobacteriota bacterium]|jgi:uncharacterized DUF497 family protein